MAAGNTDGKVAARVVGKLRVESPGEGLVTLYLKEIARTYGIDWPRGSNAANTQDDVDADDNDDEGGGGGGEKEELKEQPLTTDELSKATPPRDIGPKSPVSVAPPRSTTDNVSPSIKLPQPPELKPGVKMTKGGGATLDGVGRKKDGEVNGDAGKSGDKAGEGLGGKIPEVDELARRFAALKK